MWKWSARELSLGLERPLPSVDFRHLSRTGFWIDQLFIRFTLAMELMATGVRRQQNSIVYVCPRNPIQHVVYFQGDVQNLLSTMTSQAETAQWQEWCLENTCTLLATRFPQSAVWIIRPSRMLRLMFSCFNNFVQSSLIGVPIYRSNYGCLLQLEALLKNAVQQVNRDGALEMDVHSALCLPVVLVGFSKGCVVLNQLIHELVNYLVPAQGLYRTKLNLSQSTPSIHTPSGRRSQPSSPTLRHQSPEVRRQQGDSPENASERRTYLTPQRSLMDIGSDHRPSSTESRSRLSSTSSTRSERGATPESAVLPYRSSSFGAPVSKHIINPSESDVRNLTMFLRRLKAIYWLDAGHSGGHGAWVTESELLSRLAGLGVPVCVHVTPQQVRDPHRTWIGEEEREFVDKLRRFGAEVVEKLHFDNEERSLENHFRVLAEF